LLLDDLAIGRHDIGGPYEGVILARAVVEDILLSVAANAAAAAASVITASRGQVFSYLSFEPGRRCALTRKA
jgi:hypothetical protein